MVVDEAELDPLRSTCWPAPSALCGSSRPPFTSTHFGQRSSLGTLTWS